MLKKITSIFITVVIAAVALAVPASAADKIAAPQNTKVTAKSATTVSLQWDKVTDAAKYTVYYSTDKKKEYTAYGSTTNTKYTVKNLRSGTKYWFYVRALDKDGNKSGYAKVVSAIPKAAETKTTSTSSTTLKITKEAGTVTNNASATVKASGKPNTEYTLKVFYSTTASKAAGTGKVKSDANGNVSWTWKVGAKTKAGTHKIIIEGGGEKIETTFETVE